METSDLNVLITRYLKDSEDEGQMPSTLVKKHKLFTRLLQFSQGQPYSEQGIQDFMQTFRSKKGLKDNTLRTYGSMLRAFRNWMVENGYLEKPGKKIAIPKEKHKVFHLLSMNKTEEVIIVGTSPGTDDNKKTTQIKLEECRPCLQFSLRAGVRNAELRAIRGSDVLINEASPRVIIRSKGGNVDFVPIPTDMVDFFKSRVGREYVFQVKEDTLRAALARGCEKLGVYKIGVHDLRHTFATNLLRNGTPLQIVSRLLRHKSIAITDEYYSHYIIEDLAIEMNTKNELIMAVASGKVRSDYFRQLLIKGGADPNSILIDPDTMSGSFAWK